MIRTLFLRATSVIGVIAILLFAFSAFDSHRSTATAAFATAPQTQLEAKQVFGNPSNTLTPGIMVGNTLYLSGQLGTRGRAGGIEGETTAAIENAQNILKMAKLELTDVVTVTAYLVEGTDFSAFNKAYTALFTATPKPTRTTVIVKELVSQAKVELTMTAVKTR